MTFDDYIREQLKDPEFAARYSEALRKLRRTRCECCGGCLAHHFQVPHTVDGAIVGPLAWGRQGTDWCIAPKRWSDESGERSGG